MHDPVAGVSIVARAPCESIIGCRLHHSQQVGRQHSRVAVRMFSEPEYKRIYWASRRGMLELDLILMPFVEHRLRQLSDADQQRYVNLLECEDTELFAWFMQSQRPTDPELTAIVDQIIAFSRVAPA
jgi:antitoxin CptB